MSPCADWETLPSPDGPYQLFPDLGGAEYEALKADIARRGVLVPLERDEAGNLLDGHQRARACDELGIEAPVVVRSFTSKEDKIAHVIALNLQRRHLDPVTWGLMFERYCRARDAAVGTAGGRPPADGNHANVAQLAAELGVGRRTAEYRLAVAHLPEPLREKVGGGS